MLIFFQKLFRWKAPVEMVPWFSDLTVLSWLTLFCIAQGIFYLVLSSWKDKAKLNTGFLQFAIVLVNEWSHRLWLWMTIVWGHFTSMFFLHLWLQGYPLLVYHGRSNSKILSSAIVLICFRYIIETNPSSVIGPRLSLFQVRVSEQVDCWCVIRSICASITRTHDGRC
jgi:hypothetical protein